MRARSNIYVDAHQLKECEDGDYAEFMKAIGAHDITKAPSTFKQNYFVHYDKSFCTIKDGDWIILFEGRLSSILNADEFHEYYELLEDE